MSGDDLRQWHRLFGIYQLELPDMAYTLDDFVRESHQHLLSGLSPEERQAFLERLSPEERLRGLSPEDIQRLKDVLNKLN